VVDTEAEPVAQSVAHILDRLHALGYLRGSRVQEAGGKVLSDAMLHPAADALLPEGVPA
jgi:hypothetical protein